MRHTPNCPLAGHQLNPVPSTEICEAAIVQPRWLCPMGVANTTSRHENIADRSMTSFSRLWATLFLGALTGLSPNAAQSETIVRKSISYFQIGGRTAADLDDELARKGPFTEATGNRHPGATQIRFGGDLTYTKRGTRCAVEDATVTLETKIILPRWKNRKRASPEMAMIWDALSADIKRHEERHAEIARQHAKLLEKRLLKLRPERDCDRLQAKVTKVTDEVTRAHDMAQVEFDRIESHNFEDRMLRILRHRAGKASN